jgi:hypothetical protein
MSKNKQKKQSGASNPSDSDGNTCNSHENSLLSSFDPNVIPSLSQLPNLKVQCSAHQNNLELPPHSNLNSPPVCDTSLEVLLMMTNHNFEGFSSSLPLDDVSD